MRRIEATRRRVRVEDARMLTPSVRGLLLRDSRGEAIDYLAGQWFKLYLSGLAPEQAARLAAEGEESLDRDYSVASAPDPEAPDRFEIAVTRVEGGPGSEILHNLSVGTELEIGGPHGFFVREAEHRSRPALFVGTGTGLAPLRAMIQEELRLAPEGPPLTLLFGCRHERDILWAEELRAAEKGSRLRYEITLSRPGEGWTGRTGYVQSHLRELLAEDAHVYICGLNRMVEEVRRILRKEIGLDRRSVHSERYD